ncbi:helix-turn-helix domain-containing protein [Cohnella sp. AR92]|uniref:helix-turn-helix domain-containing protein n=1 Tax=Cohnella sp. AR92 TaxID=648716 RepID=UPI000F8CF703|nr:helix-turn-helix domain-containing protein [Cohnella sp. AR92]RUS48590.1 helix-turn-helix domain-containing protein [Cohnella sp. AR92]
MRKIAVLMIDDEILAMEHMKRLVDWEALGFEVADCVTNPKKALSIAAELKPQLIIADIRMPIMNGLELAKLVLKAGLNPRIVLLTSHKEFEYAKEAMKLGISDYWVKHEIDSASLTQELLRLREEMRSASDLQDAVRRQLLGDLLTRGTISPEQWKTIAGSKADGETLRLVALRADKPFPVLAEANSQKALPIPTDLYPLLDFEDEFLSHIGFVAIGETLCVVLQEGGVSAGRKRERLLAATEQLRERFQQANNRPACAVVSAELRDWRSLPEQYAEASRWLERSVFFGKRYTVFLENEPFPSDGNKLLWEPSVADLEQAARARDNAAIGPILTSLFALAIQEQDPVGLAECCRQLAILLNRLRAVSGLDSLDRMQRNERLADPSSWTRVEGIRDWFLQQFEQILAEQMSSPSYSRKVRQALDYIRDHYAEELTADAIAEKLGISRDHLRHLFKEETGQTVLDTLTQVRMEQAKKLLRDGSLRIYEIAERVGYRNSQYFSQVFRKQVGMTPLEYVERRESRP